MNCDQEAARHIESMEEEIERLTNELEKYKQAYENWNLVLSMPPETELTHQFKDKWTTGANINDCIERTVSGIYKSPDEALKDIEK